MFIRSLWHFLHFLFIKYICCMFWCVVLVNIVKCRKISSLRVSIYSVFLVILEWYTQTVSWSMFSYLVTVVIGVKIIFNREIAFLWWVRTKPKVLNNILLFRWSCFLLWNDSGNSKHYYHSFVIKAKFLWVYQIQLGVLGAQWAPECKSCGNKPQKKYI